MGRNDTLGVASLAQDAQDPSRVYLAMGQYTQSWAGDAFVLASADQGRSWERTNLPFKLGGNQDGRSAGERMRVDPNLGSILLLGTDDDGLWKSSDAARTWGEVTGFPEVSLTFVLFDSASGTPGSPTPTIYAGVNTLGKSLYRSSDGGEGWLPVPGQPTGLIPNHAALDSAATLYVTYGDRLGPNAMTGGAFRSDDAGERWIRINDGRHRYGWINAVIGDPRTYGRVCVAAGGRGIIAGDIAGEIIELPPPPPATAVPIYDDALAPGWQDWGWIPHDNASTAVVHGGTVSVAVTPAGAWEAL